MGIETILTSTVIAGLVGAVITYMNNRKNHNLQYITGERKEWREEIRNISEEIVASEIINIKHPLTRLKVRINAYGRHSNRWWGEDSHIWEVIYRLEKPDNQIEFERDKSLLIEFLSLLLKQDWERSKREVAGDKNLRLTLCSWVLFGITLFINMTNVLGQSMSNYSISNYNAVYLCTMLGSALVLFISPLVYYRNFARKILNIERGRAIMTYLLIVYFIVLLGISILVFHFSDLTLFLNVISIFTILATLRSWWQTIEYRYITKNRYWSSIDMTIKKYDKENNKLNIEGGDNVVG